MSQRDSGYERKERDLYETPGWATEALLPHLRELQEIWEPACGSGKMSRVLATHAKQIMRSSDIDTGTDFLVETLQVEAVITNPPYVLAREFIVHAMNLTFDKGGLVAMLLRTDYDHAKTREHLFGGCSIFARKVVLTKRIKWFEDSKGQPSFNHAWFIWDWKHDGPPQLAYGP
jgi:hypothetical protein